MPFGQQLSYSQKGLAEDTIELQADAAAVMTVTGKEGSQSIQVFAASRLWRSARHKPSTMHTAPPILYDWQTWQFSTNLLVLSRAFPTRTTLCNPRRQKLGLMGIARSELSALVRRSDFHGDHSENYVSSSASDFDKGFNSLDHVVRILSCTCAVAATSLPL